MKTIQELKIRQKEWADRHEIEIDSQCYVRNRMDNFQSKFLNPETIDELKQGDGKEWSDDENNRTKIMALHSSSALVCNFFDYWRNKDNEILKSALGIKAEISSINFEQKLSMGMRGRLPNLDVIMTLGDGSFLAIESKFTEWMSKTSKKAFADSYFKGKERWTEAGLPNCQKAAEKIYKNGKSDYCYLDAPQLLKHALGLANTHSNRSNLLYLYFDLADDSYIAKEHLVEINGFKEEIGGELSFQAMTYQEVFQKLKSKSTDQDYLDYLEERYF